MKLTTTQAAALEMLKAARPFVPVMRDGALVIDTGINTTTLHSLRRAGAINVKAIFLNGRTTRDLTINE